jgi:signal transduction histidine kinase/ligand-binding sensor domain-containing protein
MARASFGRRSLVPGLCLFWVCGLFPAVSLSAPSKGVYDIWRVEEGVQQSPVTAIVQSHDGYLWLGTYHGLGRFDGVRLTLFNSSNTTNLQNGLITTLYVSPDGVVWIGHETGQLTRFFRGLFQAVNLGRTWRGGAIEAITTDEDGDLWLLNDTGHLFRLRDGFSLQIPGASPTQKVALSRDPAGKVWLVCAGTVAVLQKGQRVPLLFPDASADDFYERVTPARDGGVWVLGKGRLRKYTAARGWVAPLRLPSPPPEAVTTMFEARSGVLLLGTLHDGLYVLGQGLEPLHFNRDSGLSHDWIRALCDDHEGNIWLGTGAGLDGLRSRKVQMLVAPDKWQGCVVRPFLVQRDGSAWIGTEGAGLYHYDAGTELWGMHRQNSGISNLFIWSVLETRQRELLVGTWGGGLLAGQDDRFEAPIVFKEITAPVTALYEGKGGDLWVGTRTGLRRYRQGKLVWSAGEDKLAFPDVRCITETENGTVWFGMSGGGLGSLKDDTLKQFRKADGLGSDFIVCLYADPEGPLWLGSSDNGLTRLKDGRFTVISTAQGLPSPIICHLVDDGAGNLWMGSLGGILRAGKADLNHCADGRFARVPFLSYGQAEGLSSQNCSGGFQPGACKGADGRLWFPTAKGLAIIDPANVSTNSVPPPVVIEEVTVGRENVDAATLASAVRVNELEAPLSRSDSSVANSVLLDPEPGMRGSRENANPNARRAPLRFPPGQQRFVFRYTALSFLAPDKVRFKHKLEGFETEWSEASSDRVAPYGYLPPGNYTFRVIACNNDELWNERGASLAFTTLPYFWQTWWFEVLALALGAAAVGVAVIWVMRSRVRRKLEQLERQRALERERARIARDIHDDLGASLTRISMLSQSVRAEVENQDQAADDLDQIYSTARELTRAMDEIVWAVNPKHDTLDSLVTYLGRFAQNFLSAAGIRCRLDVPVHLPSWALTAEVRHNVFLAFKEALHNVVKHARATEVRVSLQLLSHGFALVVADNGRGFEWDALKVRTNGPGDNLRSAAGNGLANMQKRLEEIEGGCEWETAPGEGTRVKFVVAGKV